MRAVNAGLRPIAVECIKVRNDKGTWNDVSTSVRGHNGLPTTAVIEPGNFLEWLIPESMYISEDKSHRKINVYVVDLVLKIRQIFNLVLMFCITANAIIPLFKIPSIMITNDL